MLRLNYTPKALEDIQAVKNYITRQFGTDKARRSTKEVISTIRQLGTFPKEGLRLEDLIEYLTEYRYLVVKPPLCFYFHQDRVYITNCDNT